MRLLLLVIFLTSSPLILKAAFVKDTTFISYKEFSHLSKKEIKERFYKDDDSKKIIDNYYKHKRRGLNLLWAIIPLTAVGTYLSIEASKATVGLASVVLLVLAILFFVPALILIFAFFSRVVFKKKAYTKAFFYNELKEYFQAHYQK